MRPIDTEGSGNLLYRPFASGRREQNDGVHINERLTGPRASPALFTTYLLPDQEQSVEPDRFGEGDRQDRLPQDLGCRAGIPTDSLGRFHADEAYPERRA